MKIQPSAASVRPACNARRPPERLTSLTRAAAEARLTHALDHVIPRDIWTRNNPAKLDSRSKRGAAEVPIYGWVPMKSDAALRSRPGFDAWLQTQTRRDGSGVG